MLRVLVFIAYQPYAREPNTYWNYIFVFKFEQSSHLFSLKNFRPCRDLNPEPPRYQADMLIIELSCLGLIFISYTFIEDFTYQHEQAMRPLHRNGMAAIPITFTFSAESISKRPHILLIFYPAFWNGCTHFSLFSKNLRIQNLKKNNNKC